MRSIQHHDKPPRSGSRRLHRSRRANRSHRRLRSNNRRRSLSPRHNRKHSHQQPSRPTHNSSHGMTHSPGTPPSPSRSRPAPFPAVSLKQTLRRSLINPISQQSNSVCQTIGTLIDSIVAAIKTHPDWLDCIPRPNPDGGLHVLYVGAKCEQSSDNGNSSIVLTSAPQSGLNVEPRPRP